MGISTSKFGKITLWVCLVLGILCSYLVFWYSDIGDTLDNGVLLAEAIVNGEFLDYYEYASVNSSPYSVYPANYNVLLYAIFAIWNLPTVILHIVSDFDYMASTAALLWCKSIIPVALIGIFFAVKRLTDKIGESDEDGTIAGFLSVSSLCVMVPALVASQYDCLSLLFMLLGLLFYVKDKTVPFVLMFAIAVPLKMFAVFIFIPMLLIRYKNVLKILGMLIAVMIPSFLLELPFKGDPYFEAAMGSQNGDAIELLLGASVSLGKLEINLFFVAYIAICFICYMTHKDNKITETRLAVYFSFAVFAAFCTLIPIRSYWIILFTPFLSILAAIKKGNRVVPILIDTLAGLCGGLYFLATHWIYNRSSITKQLVLYSVEMKEGTEQKYGNFQTLLEKLGLWDMRHLLFAVLLGSLVFALWYLYPEKCTDKSEDEKRGKYYWALLSRPAILIFVTAMLIYCEFAPMPAIKFGDASYEEVMDLDLMDDTKEITVSREIVFDSDETLSQMALHVDAYAYRSARALLGVRLYETKNNTVIWEDSVGIVVIEDDLAKFDLDGLEVKKNTIYKLELYAIRPELAVDGYLYPYMDADGNLAVTIR